LSATSDTKSSFTTYKAGPDDSHTKCNLSGVLHSFSGKSISMKNSSSGSEKDSMSEHSEDESDVDIVGDIDGMRF
jgi:hypothetical protein